jgi:N-acyl amino acid synthase of PEP-CTERM/exosortase system
MLPAINGFFNAVAPNAGMEEPADRVAESWPRPYGGSPSASAPIDETLPQLYARYFSAVTADTPELIRLAQEIRYQVYCVEHRFENPAENPDGRESDQFDAHAVHSLLIHRPSGQAMGTVRLVLPRPDAPEKSFAIQLLKPSRVTAEGSLFPLRTTGEVSRFSISKQFRRRKGDTPYGEQGEPDNSSDRRKGPLMRLGLIQSLVRMSAQHGITHWCAVMEPKLLRMLAGMAIHFTPVGEAVEYHGRRQPCYCHVGTVLNRVKQDRPEFWEVLTDGGRLWPSPTPRATHTEGQR